MKAFLITARTAAGAQQFTWIATSSGEAAEQAAILYEEPCGITVTCAEVNHAISDC
jgi:hypothetical protein